MVCICGHSHTDHLTGRCVNRRMYFDAAKGDAVTEVCTCKHFEEPKPKPAARKPKDEPVVDVKASAKVKVEEPPAEMPSLVEPTT